MCAWPTRASASARRRRRELPQRRWRILAAAEITGADAIHPGYGFLSENADFAQMVEEHGFTFIGPSARAHPADGRQDRRPRPRPSELGIPVVPGSDGPIAARTRRSQLRRAIGFPVLIKAVAGGGGRGMTVVRAPDELADAVRMARNEARAAFGDDSVYIERFLGSPRHIEIQVIGDGNGHVVHLGERDCSLQRRHQKVVEEAPSPASSTPPSARAAWASVVVDGACASIGYRGARHGRVPLRGRRVLLHRDEHPAAGRAPGDRADHRHRPGARADPHRRRRSR